MCKGFKAPAAAAAAGRLHLKLSGSFVCVCSSSKFEDGFLSTVLQAGRGCPPTICTPCLTHCMYPLSKPEEVPSAKLHSTDAPVQK
jgi:hypothetical protein